MSKISPDHEPDGALPAILGGDPIRQQGPPGWPPLSGEVTEVLQRLARTGEWGRYHGPHCQELQSLLKAEFCSDHAVLCSSGTAAIELCLRGVGVTPGDEVILSAYDFKSNLTNVVALGALPVLVGTKAQNAQLDVGALESARSGKTRAVIASHLHGGLVDMPRVCEWAKEHRVVVVEDVCQAPGATVGSRPAGSWGDCAALSFGGSKLLSAGRGGAVLCCSDRIAQRVKLHNERGNTAYPLSEMQAAVLIPQVRQLQQRNQIRSRSVDHLRKNLQDGSGLQPFTNRISDWTGSYYKLGLFYSPDEFNGMTRELFCRSLQAEGIAVDPGLPALHEIHARRRFCAIGDLTQTSRDIRRIVTLHHPILLESPEDVDQIAAAVLRTQRFAERIIREAHEDE